MSRLVLRREVHPSAQDLVPYQLHLPDLSLALDPDPLFDLLLVSEKLSVYKW
jgi:hypothetical protein